MTQVLSDKAQRFQSILDGNGVSGSIVEFDSPARTAREAAEAIGCDLDQIVKSLIFRIAEEDTALLVLTAGGNRVSETVVASLVDAPLDKADASFVRRHSGYAIGGVPPFGHANPLRTIVDRTLFRFDEVWAAGGTPNTVFPIAPKQLLDITGGEAAEIC